MSPHRTSAQDTSADEVNLEAVLEAARLDREAGNHARAIERLEAAPAANYRVHFNLGTLYLDTGDYLQAFETFERLLAEEFGELPERAIAPAEQYQSEAAAALAHIDLQVASPVAEGWLNGQPFEVENGRHQLRTNPGSTHILLQAEGFEPYNSTFELARAEVRSLIAELVPLPDVSPTIIVNHVATDPDVASPRRRRILGWTLGALAVVGAGLAAALVIARGGSETAFENPATGSFTALSVSQPSVPSP